ncbi:MAG: AMP-binding protein [Rubritepida sp.]|nr:AMP-binding protein [Rubritepida sp.]
MAAELAFGDLRVPAAEIARRGAALAGGLRALGLAENGAVAVLLRNGPVWADVITACRIGGTYYVALNWHLTAAELAFILADSGAKALVAEAALLEAVRTAIPAGMPVLAVGGSAPGAEDYETWLARQAPYAGPPVSPRGHMGYTSGTTGKPKGVRRQPIPLAELPARQARLRQVVEETLGVTEGSRVLVSAPLYHAGPTVIAQNALQFAERLVLAPRFDAEETLALIERHRITTVYLVPVMYVRLLRLPAETRARHDLSSLRCVASTGAPCAPEVKRAMIEWLGPIITETYASTETGMLTACRAEDSLRKPGTAGRPVAGATVRILDEAGQDCAPGAVGRIYARNHTYPDFTYHKNAEARAAIERDGLITLGDMGYLDAEGFLFVCDRASDMVISGGVNIYPAEIEAAIASEPGVLDVAVFGIPDAEFGERLHAVVQMADGASFDQAAMETALRARLAGFKVPRSWEAVASLPRDPNGKLLKRRLREPFWAGAARRV